MFPRLTRLLVLLAAVQLLGGHWAVLQTAAWVGMLADYTRGNSLEVAIEKTFDGAHPCDLCKVVKSGREQEQKQSSAKSVMKTEAVLAVRVALPQRKVAAMGYDTFGEKALRRTVAPPTPPPLAA